MSATAIAGIVQVGGALLLAPLLPGLVQNVKAKLQGRRGPSPLQPYRELRRLWGKSVVAPEGTTFVYRLAPALVAGATATACLLLPIGGLSPNWPVGNDVLVLIALLTLARFALVASAWDTSGGFGLMGASRDLTFSVLAEGLLFLVLLVAGLRLGSTDLRSLSDASAGLAVWSTPAHWLAALGFIIVILAETGRQPIDNPDTHLELTMIHEGPLLEYAGRDLAYFQWASAARHWLMLVLATELFVPHPTDFALRLLTLAVALPLLCVVLAVIETLQAKMRVLRVPSLFLIGGALCLLGLISHYLGGDAVNDTLQWALVALGFLVILVQGRSAAILLVALQAILLGVGALLLAPGRPTAFLIAGLVLLARSIPLLILLGFSVRRTRERKPVEQKMKALPNVGLALAVSLAGIALLPQLGLETPTAEHASVALLTTGIITVITRRETILQALGLLIAENGVALAAIGVPGGLPLVVELGVAIDLIVVTVVVALLHERIFEEFGGGDTHSLRKLRD